MGTPRYWMVVLFVVAVMSVWALTVTAANARSRKQNQTLGEKTCAHTAAEAVVRVEDLIFCAFPVLRLNLGINFS